MSSSNPSSSSGTTTTSTMPSSSPDPTDPTTNALKARIITHMNADHASSLSLFARHYCKLPTAQARTAQLTDIELTHLVISTTTAAPFTNYATNRTVARNYIALAPPLSSFAEARARLVAMHAEALASLGLSDIAVTQYQPPQSPFHVFVFTLCLWTWISFCYRPNLLPTAPVKLIYAFWSLGGYWPALASFMHYIQPVPITIMIVVHSAEAIYFTSTRLRKHQVQTGSAVWWSWVFSNLVEGVGAFQRFDAIVRDKEEEKKQKKH
jgi:Protein of unknown function (DUF2470)